MSGAVSKSQARSGSGATGRVHDVILERITAGQLPAGAKLTEVSLAEELQVSRTPVREALRQLAAEGLVEVHHNKGAVVAGAENLDDLFELRLLLEGYSAGMAAVRIDAGGLAELQDMQRQFELTLSHQGAGERLEAASLNLLFHERIVQAAGNKTLAVFLRSLTSLTLQRVTFETYTDEELARSVWQHRQLLDALEKRDRLFGEAAMRVHIHGAKRALREEMERDFPVGSRQSVELQD